MLGGASAAPGGMAAPMQALRGLQRNIDFQQVPHATVQQLHATIQHDFELVEQVCQTTPCMEVLKSSARYFILFLFVNPMYVVLMNMVLLHDDTALECL